MATINFEQSKSNFVLQISHENKPCVTIKNDGVVINHYEGAENDGARAFYEQLQLEGKTLYQKIDELKKELEEANKLLMYLEPNLEDEMQDKVTEYLDRNDSVSV